MGVVIVKGKGSSGVNLGRPIVTNGAFATWLFSNYFEDLFYNAHIVNRKCASMAHAVLWRENDVTKLREEGTLEIMCLRNVLKRTSYHVFQQRLY